MTGVLVKREFKPTLETALRLHPGTRQVFFIAGTSAFNRYWLDEARRELGEFEGRVKITYLSDRFKDISYYISPIGGVGYKLINNDITKLQISGGAGGSWEKNSGVERRSSGSVNAGEDFSHNLSSYATVTQKITSIANMDDFSDSFTGFSAGLATTVAKQFQVKMEFLDTYKTKPPNPLIKKNDTSLVISFLLKY